MNKKRKITIATGIFPPDVGGPATYAFGLKKELERRGIRVSAVSYGEGKNAEAKIVSRKIIKGLRHFVYFIKVLTAAREAEAIYALDITATGLPAALAAMILRKKFLIRIGGDLLWERAAESGKFSGTMEQFYKGGFYNSFKPFTFKVMKFVLGRAETIFVTALNMKDIYERYYGIKNKKIKLLPNVFEIKKEKNHFKSESHRNIVFAGRFVRYKNLERILEIFREICEKIKPARLILIGDGPERENLEKKIKELQLEGKAIMEGKKDSEGLQALLKEASLGISLAWTEYNPNFILECLANGTPVLISKENGLSVQLPEIFLADPFSKEEIKEKMIKILENQKEAEREASDFSFRYSFLDSANDFLKNFECFD
ncbi:MAG: glycosyltransferase family 4 protein [Candidatus Paceibacterota bacterium]